MEIEGLFAVLVIEPCTCPVCVRDYGHKFFLFNLVLLFKLPYEDKKRAT
jgi:hypothetical protein